MMRKFKGMIGMMAALGLSISMFGIAAAAESEISTATTTAKSVAKAVSPKTIETYKAKCASCHGMDGKGKATLAKAMNTTPDKLSLVSKQTASKTDDELIKITKDGKGKMPGYKGKISDQEITNLVDYIRTLEKVEK